MVTLMKEDPRRFMWSPSDPQHLINRVDSYGLSGLYVASVNGHLDLVTFLL